MTKWQHYSWLPFWCQQLWLGLASSHTHQRVWSETEDGTQTNKHLAAKELPCTNIPQGVFGTSPEWPKRTQWLLIGGILFHK